MHFERLVIEAENTTFSLDFHPRLTVVAGVGRLERDGLINELVTALGRGRSGVHLELASDAGARYALFRPVGGRHRVVDIGQEQDVTNAFESDDGSVNLLERAGLTERLARRQMRISPSDLATTSTQEEYVLTLAHVDQGRLWDVAWKVKEREDRLNEVAEAVGSSPEDIEAFEEIERRHHDFELALAQHERARHLWFMLGGITALGTVPAAALLGPPAAFLLGFLALAITSVSLFFWRRLEHARSREQEALDQAGAPSYLTFHINRVNGMIATDQQRKNVMRAAEYHRAALVEWQMLAGDVPVDWAIEHRREVRQAAAKLRSTIGGVRNPFAVTLSELEETTADVAHVLLAKLETLQNPPAGREILPVFLDEPFHDLEAESKAPLLELLVAASHRQQIILLTEDPDVTDWARVESITGELSIVEPRTGAPIDPVDDDRPPKRSRHVAA